MSGSGPDASQFSDLCPKALCWVWYQGPQEQGHRISAPQQASRVPLWKEFISRVEGGPASLLSGKTPALKERAAKNRLCTVCCAESLSCIRLFATRWTVAHHTLLPMGTLQARIVEWVAVSSSRGSSQPRDQSLVTHITGRFFTF